MYVNIEDKTYARGIGFQLSQHLFPGWRIFLNPKC